MHPEGPSPDEIRQHIDQLAAELIAAQTPAASEILQALSSAAEDARRQAEQAGWPEVAHAASELADTASQADRGDCPDPARVDELLRSSLARLQQALGQQTAPEPPRATNSLVQDPELLNDIIVESGEHLTAVENHMLVLERDPGNSEAVHAAFRSFHTVKGLAGFLDLTEIQSLAHEVESLLDEARNGVLSITPEVIDVVLAARDFLGRAFSQLSAAARGAPPEPCADSSELVARIRRRGQHSQEGPRPPASQPVPAEKPAAPAVSEGQQRESRPAKEEKRAETSTVKVDTAKLDYLVDMIGELVISQSQIRHDKDLVSIESPRLHRNLAQLARTTAELQRTGMAMRMVPVGQLFRRMIRLVRDLSRKAGKMAELEIVGEETELDRTIVEDLADPLIHMIRNSLDHGIESPEERRAAGKTPAGHMRLAASHRAGQIFIEVADDGRGIDRAKVLAKAHSRGLIAEGAHLSESEILNLIFEPGFSTAERVTDISGRGVGMDVVRKQVQKLRGRIEIQSQPGRGTTFFLKLPLTLAIIDGLVIGVGRERYIVPLFAVRETFRPRAEQVSSVCGRGEMVLVRGRLLPLVRLSRRFGVQPRSEDPCQGVFIIAESGDKLFCLMVDELIGKQEVVLKSLGEVIKNVAGVAGGTILGDGRVGLVLDLDGVFERRNA